MDNLDQEESIKIFEYQVSKKNSKETNTQRTHKKRGWQKHHQKACANNQEVKEPKRTPWSRKCTLWVKSRQKGEKTTPGSRENFVKLFGKLSLNYK